MDSRRLCGTLGLTEARILALSSGTLANLSPAYSHLTPQGGKAIEVGPLPRYPGLRLHRLEFLLGEGRRLSKQREEEHNPGRRTTHDATLVAAAADFVGSFKEISLARRLRMIQSLKKHRR
jgi:hypothetical protein